MHAAGTTMKKKQESEIGGQCALLIAAERGAEDANSQREQERVHQHQHRAPEFATGDPPQQHRDGQHREHRQQPVEPAHRSRHQLSQHHVVPLQVGQKEQAERSLALLHAQAIGCRAASVGQAIDHHDPGQPFKDVAPGLRGRQGEGEHENDDRDEDGRQSDAQAHPIGGPLPCRRAQLPLDYGQDGHLLERLCTIGVRRARRVEGDCHQVSRRVKVHRFHRLIHVAHGPVGRR